MNCNCEDENKGYSDFKNEISENLSKLNQFLNRPISLSKRIQIECNATDILQKLVDFCNNNFLSSFSLELKMVE